MATRLRKAVDVNQKLALLAELPAELAGQDSAQNELTQAKKKRIIELPVPDARELPEYEQFTSKDFVQPAVYLRRLPVYRDASASAGGNDARADTLDEAVLAGMDYDMDADDEAWLSAAGDKASWRSRPETRLTWFGFEWLIERLELYMGGMGAIGAPGVTITPLEAANTFAEEMQVTAQREDEARRALAAGSSASSSSSSAAGSAGLPPPPPPGRPPLLPPALLAPSANATVRRIIEDVTKWWIEKRAKLKKPLLRRFWQPTAPGDRDPHHTFRVQAEKEQYRLRRTRKNDADTLHKLRSLVEDVGAATGLLDLVRAREVVKRDLVAAGLDGELLKCCEARAVRMPTLLTLSTLLTPLLLVLLFSAVVQCSVD